MEQKEWKWFRDALIGLGANPEVPAEVWYDETWDRITVRILDKRVLRLFGDYPCGPDYVVFRFWLDDEDELLFQERYDDGYSVTFGEDRSPNCSLLVIRSLIYVLSGGEEVWKFERELKKELCPTCRCRT